MIGSTAAAIKFHLFVCFRFEHTHTQTERHSNEHVSATEALTRALIMKLTIGYCQHKSSYMKGKMAALCKLVKSV